MNAPTLPELWHDYIAMEKYGYRWIWMGVPIIQEPQDIIAMQELIWRVKPDLIIETGIAHGGSLLFHASMMHLMGNGGVVIGIDIDIRDHAVKNLSGSNLKNHFIAIESDSVDERVVEIVTELSGCCKTILVSLDSNHTESHVLKELDAYAGLVTKGSYCIVWDTGLETFPQSLAEGKPFGKGNNPMTALNKWLPLHPEFEPDKEIENKMIVTSSPGGWLKRVG